MAVSTAPAPIGIRSGDDEFLLTVPERMHTEIRSTFRDVLAEVGQGATQVVVTEAAQQFALTVNGALWSPAPDQTLADQLAYVLLRASLDAHPERLHLHCAAVAWQHRTLLLAGSPGSGKSTLTTHLVEQGFDYATDERVSVGADLRMVPFTRPISLAAPSFALFPHLDPRRTGVGSASERLWHVPASAVRAGSVTTSLQPAAVLFVEYHAGAITQFVPLHPAEAVRLLLADSADAGRFGAAAVPLVARLCAGLTCGRLVFGDERAAAARLRTFAAAPMPLSATIEVLELAPDTTPAGPCPGPSPDVTGVVVGDRCVLHRAATGEVVELDEVTSVWFRLFDGRTPLDALVQEVADANGLPYHHVMVLAKGVVQRLSENGLVRPGVQR